MRLVGYSCKTTVTEWLRRLAEKLEEPWGDDEADDLALEYAQSDMSLGERLGDDMEAFEE